MAHLKMLATALTIGSAGVGGLFIPSIVIGATLGSSLSIIQRDATSLFVALGMSSFLSAAFKTPLAAVTFVAKTKGSEEYIIPGLVASAVAYVSSGKHSLLRNQKVTEAARVEELKRIKVSDLMSAPSEVLIDDLSLKEFFNSYFLRRSDYSVFPVKREDGRIIGVVTVRDLNRFQPSEWERVKLIDIVRKVDFLKPDDSLMAALNKMYESGLFCLPVIDPKKGEIVGMLTGDAIAM